MRLHFIFIMSTEGRHVLMLEKSTQTNVKRPNSYLWPAWMFKKMRGSKVERERE